MAEKRDPFIKDDGWDKDALDDVGLMEFIMDVQRVAYDIRNCQRGAYAVDLGAKVIAWKEDLEGIIEQMEVKLG